MENKGFRLSSEPVPKFNLYEGLHPLILNLILIIESKTDSQPSISESNGDVTNPWRVEPTSVPLYLKAHRQTGYWILHQHYKLRNVNNFIIVIMQYVYSMACNHFLGYFSTIQQVSMLGELWYYQKRLILKRNIMVGIKNFYTIIFKRFVAYSKQITTLKF